MDFLNKLGDTITGAGKEITNKTKELSVTVKLNTQIAKEKEELNELYKKLGNMYFENCNQFAVGEFREVCDEIISVKGIIEKLEKDLRTLKGFRKCPECNKMIPIDDKFCCGCGKEIKECNEEEIEENIVEENNPENTVEFNDEIILIDKTEDEEKEEFKEEVKEEFKEESNENVILLEEPQQEVNKNICPACKEEIEENDIFCSACGVNIKEFLNKSEIEKKENEEIIEENQMKKCKNCGMELDEDDAFCSNCGTKV